MTLCQKQQIAKWGEIKSQMINGDCIECRKGPCPQIGNNDDCTYTVTVVPSVPGSVAIGNTVYYPHANQMRTLKDIMLDAERYQAIRASGLIASDGSISGGLMTSIYAMYEDDRQEIDAVADKLIKQQKGK